MFTNNMICSINVQSRDCCCYFVTPPSRPVPSWHMCHIQCGSH